MTFVTLSILYLRNNSSIWWYQSVYCNKWPKTIPSCSMIFIILFIHMIYVQSCYLTNTLFQTSLLSWTSSCTSLISRVRALTASSKSCSRLAWTLHLNLNEISVFNRSIKYLTLVIGWCSPFLMLNHSSVPVCEKSSSEIMQLIIVNYNVSHLMSRYNFTHCYWTVSYQHRIINLVV